MPHETSTAIPRSMRVFLTTAALVLGALMLFEPAVGQGADPAPENPESEPWIALVDEALLPGDSMLARARIETRDGMGGTSLDVIDIVRASFGTTTRTLIEVEAPEPGEGVAYERVAEPGKPLERWVWLPEVRRLRRIAGVRRTDPFLGTEFTYEDLGLATPVERRAGDARWIEGSGSRLLELESPSYHYYDRVVTRVDPETNLPTTVSFYDRAGQLYRQQYFEDVRETDGNRFPWRIRVRNRLTGAESVLTFEAVRFGVDVPRERFSESTVRRHLRRAEELIPDAAVKPPE
jgi:hypothetical protein